MKKAFVGGLVVLCAAGVAVGDLSGSLLFSSWNGSDHDLYIMSADGSNLRQIADGVGNTVGQARFSPDGRTILYTVHPYPGSGSYYPTDIYQVAVGGGTPRLVPGCEDLRSIAGLAWGDSPDHFFYSMHLSGGPGSKDFDTYRRTHFLDADGFLGALAGQVSLPSSDELNASLFDVKEKFNRSVYSDQVPEGGSPTGAVLVTYDADGTDREVLSVTNDGKSDSMARISPNGRYVLYGKSETGWQNPHNIYMTTYLDSGKETRLTNYTGDYIAHFPVWRDNDSFFYSVGQGSSQLNMALHLYSISTGTDVMIPVPLSDCRVLDYTRVPAPGAVVLAGLGLGYSMALLRRRRVS